MPNLIEAINLLNAKRYYEGLEVLEDLIKLDPNNPDILYNLGMVHSQLNSPKAAIKVLEHCIESNPSHSNAFVALGFAYSLVEDYEKAKSYFLKALKISPNNPYALRNLGGIFGKLNDFYKSLIYLKKAFELIPDDPQTVYGLGYAYLELGDIENAQKQFKKIIEIDPPKEIKTLAESHLRDIAVKHLQSVGFRPDVMFYCLSALRLFNSKSPEEVKTIVFEIALKAVQDWILTILI